VPDFPLFGQIRMISVVLGRAAPGAPRQPSRAADARRAVSASMRVDTRSVKAGGVVADDERGDAARDADLGKHRDRRVRASWSWMVMGARHGSPSSSTFPPALPHSPSALVAASFIRTATSSSSASNRPE